MTYYRLFLTKDKRTEVTYNHFIGGTRKILPYYYIKNVELWDVLSRSYGKEKVMLKQVTVNNKERIIKVEVSDGLL